MSPHQMNPNSLLKKFMIGTKTPPKVGEVATVTLVAFTVVIVLVLTELVKFCAALAGTVVTTVLTGALVMGAVVEVGSTVVTTLV